MPIKNVEQFKRNSLGYGDADAESIERSKAYAKRQVQELEEKAFRDAIVKENREKQEKAERENNEKMFLQKARLDFFAANPAASEGDFKRLLPRITDEFMLSNFRKVRENNTPDWFNAEFQ